VRFADVVTQLEDGLRRELPGQEAQERLSPVPRREWPAGFNPARIRNAAGLLLVFPKPATTINAETAELAEQENTLRSPSEENTSLRVPRVLRSSSSGSAYAESAENNSLRASRALRSSSSGDAHIVLTVRADTLRHGGQVSLPGGVVEPGETFEQAALREAHEEVALPLAQVRVLGALTWLDIPVSGFRIHPIVAATDSRPPLTPADAEVARILEVGVDQLLDPANFVRTSREHDGRRYVVPAFRFDDHEIWGATAMILAEFLALLGAPSRR
jgi:8-oxo-dGTP pyrophosphatase MutT (NUDIX family)